MSIQLCNLFLPVVMLITGVMNLLVGIEGMKNEKNAGK